MPTKYIRCSALGLHQKSGHTIHVLFRNTEDPHDLVGYYMTPENYDTHPLLVEVTPEDFTLSPLLPAPSNFHVYEDQA